MSETRTVLYTRGMDEFVTRFDLEMDHPENGDDWGLVAHGETGTRIQFVRSSETITIHHETYQELRKDDYTTEYEIENAGIALQQIGIDAVMSYDGDVSVLEFDEYARAVAYVYVWEAENVERGVEWPVAPGSE